jgi:hypothetical protein
VGLSGAWLGLRGGGFDYDACAPAATPETLRHWVSGEGSQTACGPLEVRYPYSCSLSCGGLSPRTASGVRENP